MDKEVPAITESSFPDEDIHIEHSAEVVHPEKVIDSPKQPPDKQTALKEQVSCSWCHKDIEVATAMFRCVECSCADALMCWDCLPKAHVQHCVMRLPSARVYVSASVIVVGRYVIKYWVISKLKVISSRLSPITWRKKKAS